MKYYGDVYRPPSEARSLIIQATLGCSNNTCAFCTMYKAKKFIIRPIEDVIQDLMDCREYYSVVRRIFIADGDALEAPTEYLVELLETIAKLFPECERITSYATPQSIRKKTEEELRIIRSKNLSMLYMGLESGDDEVLRLMRKNQTSTQIIEAGRKARDAGFSLSVTAITGLGGKAMWKQHAVNTAKAFNEMKPEFIGLLTLMVDPGTPLEKWVNDGSFEMLSSDEILEELYLTMESFDSPGSVFRMNHASNYLVLRGTLNDDKGRMLSEIKRAMEDDSRLRPEYFRAL